MEKKSVTKKVVKLNPDGSCITTFTDVKFRTVLDIAADLDEERQFYWGNSRNIQSIEEADDASVLSVLYRDGTIKMITYIIN